MNPSTALATVVVDELIRLGVRDAVLCPGSRSAPLAYALHEADRVGRVRLHVRIDERAAAFLAVGLGKATGVPAAVVTTSGTAVANLHPAVLEAGEAGVPLILLTADRPPELRGTRANQTTDQVKLFGSAVRWFHGMGTPHRRGAQQAAWRTTMDRAFAAATGAFDSNPGPVHVNIPFREPLVPSPLDGGVWPEPLSGRSDGAAWTQLPTGPHRPMVGGLGAPTSDVGDGLDARVGDHLSVGLGGEPSAGIDWVERTLVVLGDLPGLGRFTAPRDGEDVVGGSATGDAARGGLLWNAGEVCGWARARGWPVLAEPFGLRTEGASLPHAPLLAQAAEVVPHLRPDRILVVGRLTLSRSMAALLRLPGIRVELVTAQPTWADPGHVVHRVHPWSVLARPEPEHKDAATADSATDAGGPSSAWLDNWRAAAAVVHTAVETLLTERWPSGPAVAAEVLAGATTGGVLFVGSSNSVRDVDIARMGDGLFVAASRGLAGIDGNVSTAVGVALAVPQRPAYALLGDLAFLHDANGLLIGPDEPRPDLTFVVVNDDGGGIFTLLEYGQPAYAAGFERVFGTPTGARIGEMCRAYRVDHVAVADRDDLRAALNRPSQGLRVVEVAVARAEHRGFHDDLTRTARQALASLIASDHE